MANPSNTVVIFTMRQSFPCGPQSSCCGPVGQSAEEIENLKSGIERSIGQTVEVVDATDYDRMMEYPAVNRLLSSFGPAALPIIAVNGEVVSMGNPSIEEAVAAIRQSMAVT